jgi:hypothetical protein
LDMVVVQQRNQEKKQCLFERIIQMQEKHSELDTIVIHPVQDIKQDTGLVESGNNKIKVII